MGGKLIRAAVEFIVYLLMLLCVTAFFTGHGTFIYEGF